MKVFSLTGRSGTGKSYQAQSVCEGLGIESIIDDGLFIYHNSVEAGESAKRQKTKVAAIKAALFYKDDKAREAKRRIRELAPKTILILGTSDRMADMIADRLGLPSVSERIYIEEITTEEDREAAQRQRLNEGKHVIPVPTLQLKRDFAGYFLDPMKLWRKAVSATERTTEAIRTQGISGAFSQSGQDKSIVRPTYSYLGDFLISEKVIEDIAVLTAECLKGIASVREAYGNMSPDNLIVNTILEIERDAMIIDVAEKYQRKFIRAIETMTAFNVVRVNVEISNII